MYMYMLSRSHDGDDYQGEPLEGRRDERSGDESSHTSSRRPSRGSPW